ncbi:MAG: hypothetical protein JRG97_11995 [Deltaproteobacteria bacterium]|nr:hypothetical protein [Deltaproteobacteria bacterium]
MSSATNTPPALVRVARGGLTESLHRGSIAVVDSSRPWVTRRLTFSCARQPSRPRLYRLSKLGPLTCSV